MARWFPSGLSALSGQISNFTKEVLADGVEEIDDHVTELRNAKSRIAELETVLSAQKAELERVQQVNNELTIQLHAYELQRVALADQYRAELTLREQEIKKLHEQLSDLHSQHSPTEFTHRFSSDSFKEIDLSNNGDVHGADFDDVISSQREINGLRTEVRRLAAEAKHWRHLASDSQSTSVSLPDPETNGQSVGQLQAQLQTLQKRLADTVDDHQHQLSSLQDVHRSTVSTLKSTHSKTVEQLRKQLETATTAGSITTAAVPAAAAAAVPAAAGADIEELKQLREQLRDAEKVRMKLEYDLEHTHAADHKKALVINELHEQLAAFKSQDDKVSELEKQVETYRQQVEQFEVVNSDWELEKASLEELVVKLRQETRLKDDALHSSPIKKRVDENNISMTGIDSEIAAGTALKTESGSGEKNDGELKTLNDRLTAMLSENEQLKLKVENTSTQINALIQELQSSNDLVENLKMEMESVKSQHRQELEKANGIADDYRQKAEKSREDLAAVLNEKQALETLIGQHKNELGSLLAEKTELTEKLEKTVKELTEQYDDLASENASMKRQIDELLSSRAESTESEMEGKSSSLTGGKELELELETCRNELGRLRSSLMQREKEHDESVTELTSELDLLRSQKDEMEKSHVELVGSDEESVSKLRAEVEALEAERERSEQHVAELTAENEKLKESYEESLTVCKLYESEVERLSAVEEQLPKELDVRPAAEKHLHDNKIVLELQNEIEALRSNLVEKDSALNEWKQRLNEVEVRASPTEDLANVVTQLEKEISDLKTQLVSREMEADRWKNKFEEWVQASGDQVKVLSKLESELSVLRSELASKDQELMEWKRKMEAVGKSSVEKVKCQEGVISELENQVSGMKSQLEAQHAELEESRVRLERLVETESDSRENAAAASELENELRDLRYQLASRDLELEERKNMIKDLEQKLTASAGENRRFEEELQQVKAANAQNKSSLTNGVESKTFVENGQNGDTEQEVSQLRSTINQQKSIIDTLNSKYDSLRALLEDRSQETHGSSVLSDLHRLEVEARELRADRERLLTVLGEKTRESSGLRAEVHRLTSVAAASQSALNKAHRDSHQVANSARIESNQDMKNEAVKKLSQLIKDKDMEIEALRLKNATLTQVLQDTVPDGSKLAAVFNEANSLRTQLTVFQSDREQLIAALTSKHQESVGFYEESRRLAAHVAQLNDEVQHRAREHESLSLQYEENKRSLCSALGELATLRQRRTELERQLANIPQPSPPMFSIGPLEESSVIRSGAVTTETTLENANDAGDQEVSDEISAELESLRSEIRRGRDAVTEKEAAVRERDRRIADLERSIGLKNAALEAKLNEISEVSTKLRVAEQTLSARGSELLSARKQCESAAFELQGERVSKRELTEERDELRRRVESLGGELQAVQTSYSALTASSGQKDFELASLRDQVTSLQKVVESGRGASHGERHQEELKMMSEQLDGVRLQAQTLQYERDSSFMALQQLQTECTELKNEVARLSDREQRLVKECDRLRSHLVQMEDSYTREAVEAEEREKQLRNRLSTVEDKIISSSSAMHNVQLDSAKQVENLQIQLHALAEQRDNALYQLSSAQERISSYASSLSNLQMVLEQFQAERQQQQSLEIERYRRDYHREHEEAEKLRHQLHDLQVELNEASDALEAAHRLSEQLDRKDAMISALREEVHLREAELAKTEEQVRRLTTTTESKIDKIIIKNLLLGYFHTPPTKRNEALQVIGQVLSYSRDEMKEIASLSGSSAEGGGWIGGLFRRKQSTSSSPSHSRPSSSAANNPYHSFTELFVNFLERESSPQPTAMKLPTDRMIQEQQQKQQRRTPTSTTPAFNPFSASVLHPSSALLTASGDLVSLPPTGNPDSVHPLMRPISPPRLPVFAPVVSEHDTSLSQPSGRSSATNSGRSTPSSGTSLRDLLQQR